VKAEGDGRKEGLLRKRGERARADYRGEEVAALIGGGIKIFGSRNEKNRPSGGMRSFLSKPWMCKAT